MVVMQDLPVTLVPTPRRPATPGERDGLRRVLVVHGDPVARRSLAERLGDLGATTVAEVASGDDVARVQDGSGGWDLVILELPENSPDPAALLAGISVDAETRVVVLPHRATSTVVGRALTAGARGVLLPSRPARPAPAAAAAAPSGSAHALRDVNGVVRVISERERQILQLTADGLSNRDIAERLGVSPLTVKSHLNRIGRRLGNGDRANLVLLALRGGVIS